MIQRAGDVTAAYPLFQAESGSSILTPALKVALDPKRARPPELNTVKEAANVVLQSLKDNESKPSYGSDDWLIRGELRSKVVGWIRDEFKALCCKSLSDVFACLNDDDLLKLYVQCRKYGWQELKDGGCIADAGGTIYAYMGLNANYQSKRLCKIGFTQDNLEQYLHGLKRSHDPLPLGWIPGTERHERMLHGRWRHLRLEGREWFNFTSDLADWIYKEWCLFPEFSQLRQDYCDR